MSPRQEFLILIGINFREIPSGESTRVKVWQRTLKFPRTQFWPRQETFLRPVRLFLRPIRFWKIVVRCQKFVSPRSQFVSKARRWACTDMNTSNFPYTKHLCQKSLSLLWTSLQKTLVAKGALLPNKPLVLVRHFPHPPYFLDIYPPSNPR